jgi:hypothetical protein
VEVPIEYIDGILSDCQSRYDVPREFTRSLALSAEPMQRSTVLAEYPYLMAPMIKYVDVASARSADVGYAAEKDPCVDVTEPQTLTERKLW